MLVIILNLIKMVKQGNLSKDRKVYSWKEGSIRKSHTLGINDFLISIGLTNEFIIYQKNKPLQFMVLDLHAISNFLKRKIDKGINLYLSKDAFILLEPELSKFVNMETIHIVHPAYTRTDAGFSSQAHPNQNANPAPNQGASSSQAHQNTGASSSQAQSNQDSSNEQNIHELSDAESDNDEPPIGVYAWTNKYNTTLETLLCSNDMRTRFLRHETRPKCNSSRFNELSSKLSCEPGTSMKKCVRDLLKHLHPDKLSSEQKNCGEEMYKQVSQLKTELEQRPGFNFDREC